MHNQEPVLGVPCKCWRENGLSQPGDMGNSIMNGVVQGVFGEGFTLEAMVTIAVYQGLAVRTIGS